MPLLLSSQARICLMTTSLEMRLRETLRRPPSTFRSASETMLLLPAWEERASDVAHTYTLWRSLPLTQQHIHTNIYKYVTNSF